MKSLSPLGIVEVVVLVVISLLTISGNFLVVVSFVFGPRCIRTVTNSFVVNLAVSDILVGLLSVPFWIACLLAPEKTVYTKAYEFFLCFDILCGTTSIFNLTAISLERMCAVKFPRQHFTMKRSRILSLVAITWLSGLVLAGSKLSFHSDNTPKLKWYTASVVVLAFLLPLMVILTAYVVIFRCAVKMMRDNFNRNAQQLRKEVNIAKMISLIIGLFALCWTPFFVVNIVFVFSSEATLRRIPTWIINVTKIMHYSNSAMNFLIYGIKSPDFRRAFRFVLKCNFKNLAAHSSTRQMSVSRKASTTTISERISERKKSETRGLIN